MQACATNHQQRRGILGTNTIAANKWAAFYLSLVVPGAGQLFARRWTCVLWFLVTALITILVAIGNTYSESVSRWVGFVALAAVALASAEDAKRCLEPRPDRRAASLSTRVSY